MATGLSCGCTKSSFVSYQGRDNDRQICWVLSSLASLVQRHTIASRIRFYGHLNQRLHVMDTHNQSEPLYVSYSCISHLQLPVCVQTLNRNGLCDCCDWNDCICAHTNPEPERGHVTNSGLLLTVARLPRLSLHTEHEQHHHCNITIHGGAVWYSVSLSTLWAGMPVYRWCHCAVSLPDTLVCMFVCTSMSPMQRPRVVRQLSPGQLVKLWIGLPVHNYCHEFLSGSEVPVWLRWLPTRFGTARGTSLIAVFFAYYPLDKNGVW